MRGTTFASPRAVRSGLWLAAIFLAATGTVSQPANAQSIYGSLVGVVYDSSGASIPQSEIVVKNIETGIERKTATDSLGFFRMPALQPGRYSVSSAMKGFETMILGPIIVEPAVERKLEFTLKPSATSEVVQVTAETPLIEATRAQISRGVNSKQILELPGLNSLNGLALIAPGVVNNNNGRPGSGFVVNGNRSRSNNFMLDGANNNDQSLSIPRQTIAPENLAEFRIITNQFSAEFGRNAGSVVQQITKSGTNDFHGIARWAWLGNGYNALRTGQERTFNGRKAAGLSDYLATRAARGVEVVNQFVLSGGGPIVKDRAFLYASWDTDRFRTTAVPIAITLAPAAYDALTANSALFARGTVDFLKQNYPVANDPTPRGTINVAVPNGPTLALPLQQYSRGAGAALSYGRNFHRGVANANLKVTSKDDLAIRLVIDDLPDPGAPASLEVNQLGSATRNYNATINNVHVFSPTMIAENRITYGRREALFVENFPTQFSISGSNLPAIGNQNFPQGRVDNLYELTSNWSINKTGHTIRFGGNYLQYRLNSFFAPSLRGVISYPSMVDFLLDRSANFSQYAGTGSVPAKTHELGAFLGDDWRVSRSLTLNLGVRYEYTSTPFGYFSNASADINNWAPRVGFAWSPRGGRTVIRGGYAITYDQVFQNILLNVSRNYPRGVTVTRNNQTGTRIFDPATRTAPPQPSDFTGNTLTLPYRLYSPNKRIGQPYSQQFSLGIERQLSGTLVAKLFYVGTRGVNLIRESESNIGFIQAAVNANPSLYAPVIGNLKPITTSSGPALITDPARGSILVGDGYGQSTYHSGQFTLSKRATGVALMGKSLGEFQVDFNYTWSTFINDTDDILGGQANRTLASVPFNRQLDRARSGFDQPHRASINFGWETPKFFGGKGVMGRITDQWRLSSITTMFQGTPYTVLTATNPLGILPGQIGTIDLSQRAVYNPSGVPLTGTNPTQPNPQFIAPAANSAVIGMGANVLRVGDTYNVDAALGKFIPTFGESQGIEFRWEVFNALNHRNFAAIPSNTVSANTNNALFLNLGQTDVGGRSMLFLVRYIW